ncbi:histidinol-phosphatase HisJ family protein [Butyrivibrio fibrisolvens]|uniref:histidinol-phosphatase HisJ family protein n=1 Tax=Pseudobutyrivibrio ruminis TaxID=46206 RepID=UPI0003FAB754|nr:histidinol-phosphatase HisJ family protein [Pseudobutyrivibrio ruminis]MDC7278693.1 histidinol-phosphatase HisJ family protein [Butyrivibrio fibrisolvens]
MFWDNHMHSNFSGDSDAAPIDMINAARAKKLRGITFTDHMDLDYPPKYGFFELDPYSYYEAQHKLALEQSDANFTVLTGIELGIQPHIADDIYKVAKDIPFDFIIGSTHLIDKQDPYFDTFWESGDARQLLTRYYECVLENISAFTDFDTVAHLDYAFRYAKDSAVKEDTHQPYYEIVDEILNKIIKMDKALEINTGGLRKGLSNPNPTKSIIKRYHELGGKMITLGADAHMPEHVAADFEKLPELLADCGFKEFVVYKNRKPEAYPL